MEMDLKPYQWKKKLKYIIPAFNILHLRLCDESGAKMKTKKWSI